METIIGFAAGYLAGAKEGPAGLERLKASVSAIAKSPQTRRLVGEAVAVAGAVARQTAARGLGASATGVADAIMKRVSETGADRRRA